MIHLIDIQEKNLPGNPKWGTLTISTKRQHFCLNIDSEIHNNSCFIFFHQEFHSKNLHGVSVWADFFPGLPINSPASQQTAEQREGKNRSFEELLLCLLIVNGRQFSPKATCLLYILLQNTHFFYFSVRGDSKYFFLQKLSYHREFSMRPHKNNTDGFS